nr:adenylate isopentenyltransferase 5, chloroplastic-like [Solanum lycopersicum]
MGAIGTGKSRVSVDLATHFRGEIINSDKMQVYKGLEIITNKISHTERQGEIEQDSDFTAEDFCLQAIITIEKKLKTQRVPIIVGGSNSYIQKLVEDPVLMFKYKYDSCFIWIDIEQSFLNRRVDMRVDQMVKAVNFYKMNTFINNEEFKKKVIFIMGAIGTGKSRVSVDLTTHFRGEIINSDKMQVYKGLKIITNKISHTEKQGEIEPDSDFTAEDFFLQAVICIEKILKTQRVPIIVGGSNSVDMRVDQMVKAGLVDEVRQIFIPDADYTKGIRLSIGVPEMDRYLREETNIDGDDESKKMILQASISSIKRNTRMLICNQLDKIKRSISEKMWSVHHSIALDVFKEDREEDLEEAWKNIVLQPCLDIVKRFLKNDHRNIIIECT